NIMRENVATHDVASPRAKPHLVVFRAALIIYDDVSMHQHFWDVLSLCIVNRKIFRYEGDQNWRNLYQTLNLSSFWELAVYFNGYFEFNGEDFYVLTSL